MSFYDYTVTKRDGGEFSTREFEGKVVLVVNTATGCGFTPHYGRISDMYDKYADQGFDVLDIPSTQFPNPSGETPTFRYCDEQFHTRFEQMADADVTGENTIPLYQFLTSEKGFEGFAPGADALVEAVTAMDPDYESSDSIKWNFTKFVIDREGNVLARFEPTTSPREVDAFIKSVL
ncbi:MAG: hypothetical protein IKZ87_00260 [Actinomycetaceae bacterium]|nr:hypothetical protein [Actinomycetaceae bacterium]